LYINSEGKNLVVRNIQCYHGEPTIKRKKEKAERLKDSEAKQLKSSEKTVTEMLTTTTIPIVVLIEAGIVTQAGTVGANPTRLHSHFCVLCELICPHGNLPASKNIASEIATNQNKSEGLIEIPEMAIPIFTQDYIAGIG
jgi:hypothetical protein